MYNYANIKQANWTSYFSGLLLTLRTHDLEDIGDIIAAVRLRVSHSCQVLGRNHPHFKCRVCHQVVTLGRRNLNLGCKRRCGKKKKEFQS